MMSNISIRQTKNTIGNLFPNCESLKHGKGKGHAITGHKGMDEV